MADYRRRVQFVSWRSKPITPGVSSFLSGIHNPSVTAFFGHAKMMADNGYFSLLIEMRSHGRSEGKIYAGTRAPDTKAESNITWRSRHKDLPAVPASGGATAIT